MHQEQALHFEIISARVGISRRRKDEVGAVVADILARDSGSKPLSQSGEIAFPAGGVFRG